MENPTQNDHPIHDLLRRRWSPNAFDDRPIEPEKLRSLLEAARWAPSSSNLQPWHFIVAEKGTEGHARLAGCLTGNNTDWAPHAPVLMLAVAHLDRKPDVTNRHAWYDVGQAVAHMTVQAMAMDLFVHQMGGFSRSKAIEAFDIPDRREPTTAIAIGYLSETYKAKSRTRRPLKDFVFGKTWGEPLS